MRIKLVAARGSELDEIKDACEHQGVNIVNSDEDVLIFIYKDEYRRAKNLAKSVKDQTILSYHRNPKHIPEVWDIIYGDNKKYDCVKCDYYINGNGFFVDIVDNIKLISDTVKTKGVDTMSEYYEVDLIDKIIREQTRVYLNKNKDYGNSFVDQLDQFGSVAFSVVAGFKISRMVQLCDGQTPEHESAIDSYLDLLNYTAMFMMWETNKNTLKDFVNILNNILYKKEISLTDAINSINPLSDKEKEAIKKVSEELLKQYE